MAILQRHTQPSRRFRPKMPAVAIIPVFQRCVTPLRAVAWRTRDSGIISAIKREGETSMSLAIFRTKPTVRSERVETGLHKCHSAAANGTPAHTEAV